METDLDEFSFANALLSLRYSKDDLDEDRSLASEVKIAKRSHGLPIIPSNQTKAVKRDLPTGHEPSKILDFSDLMQASLFKPEEDFAETKEHIDSRTVSTDSFSAEGRRRTGIAGIQRSKSQRSPRSPPTSPTFLGLSCASLDTIDSDASDKKFRGRYKCSRCGELKTNHVCVVVEEFPVVPMNSVASQSEPIYVPAPAKNTKDDATLPTEAEVFGNYRTITVRRRPAPALSSYQNSSSSSCSGSMSSVSSTDSSEANTDNSTDNGADTGKTYSIFLHDAESTSLLHLKKRPYCPPPISTAPSLSASSNALVSTITPTNAKPSSTAMKKPISTSTSTSSSTKALSIDVPTLETSYGCPPLGRSRLSPGTRSPRCLSVQMPTSPNSTATRPTPKSPPITPMSPLFTHPPSKASSTTSLMPQSQLQTQSQSQTQLQSFYMGYNFPHPAAATNCNIIGSNGTNGISGANLSAMLAMNGMNQGYGFAEYLGRNGEAFGRALVTPQSTQSQSSSSFQASSSNQNPNSTTIKRTTPKFFGLTTDNQLAPPTHNTTTIVERRPPQTHALRVEQQ